jgi:hypothetical protein
VLRTASVDPSGWPRCHPKFWGVGAFRPGATIRRWLAGLLSRPLSSQVAVIIEPARRAELEPVIAAGYRLTAREAQTMTLVLRGLPTKTIAKTLRVTTNTANDAPGQMRAFGGPGISDLFNARCPRRGTAQPRWPGGGCCVTAGLAGARRG